MGRTECHPPQPSIAMLEIISALLPLYIFARMFEVFARDPAPHPAVRLVAGLTMLTAFVAAVYVIYAFGELRQSLDLLMQALATGGAL